MTLRDGRSSRATSSGRTLHADAGRVLATWQAPDHAQESLRQVYVDHLAAEPTAMTRDCHPDHLTASALVIRADGSEVLLTKHAKAGLWLQTGGHCETGDSTLAQAALREAVEESGISDLTIDPRPVLLSRHEVPFCGPVQPAHHLDVQYVAIASADAQAVISDESDDLAWWPVEALPDLTDQGVRDLVRAARDRLSAIAS